MRNTQSLCLTALRSKLKSIVDNIDESELRYHLQCETNEDEAAREIFYLLANFDWRTLKPTTKA